MMKQKKKKIQRTRHGKKMGKVNSPEKFFNDERNHRNGH